MTTLFVGLGRMGSPMARHYAATHELILFDTGPSGEELARELGVRALAALGDVPEDVDTVILMLPNSAIVESVLDGDSGLLSRLRPGALVIDMGSSVPESTRRLAQAAASRGIGFVDAPVSGGVAKASDGTLSAMAGGDPADIERAVPHLTSMVSVITKVGPAGSGHAAKALNNLLSATNIAAAAEIVSVAALSGIDPGVMIDVLNSSTGRSQASEVKFPRHILTGRFDSGFAFDLMLKDLRIAAGIASGANAVTPVTSAAFQLATSASTELVPHPSDHTELARYVEFLNSVELAHD